MPGARMPKAADLTTPIVSENLAQQAFDRIERAILAGDLSPGDTVAEASLARRLGISRGPLREALVKLEGLGLVTKTANQRPRITALSRDELMDLLVFREAIEGMAARHAAMNATATDIDRMDKLLTRHEQDPDIKAGRVYQQGSGDLDYHLQIARASRNARLHAVLDGPLYSILQLYRRRYSGASGRTLQALAEHRAILEAIRARDPDAAETRMRDHISRSRDNMIRFVDEADHKEQ
jgi:DNA-binding GntR family transcriptional regulator